MNGLCADCFPHNQRSDCSILNAHSCQIGNSHVICSDASLRIAFEKLAERHHVLLVAQSAFDRVMELSETRRLPTVINRDDVSASKDVRSQLLFAWFI